MKLCTAPAAMAGYFQAKACVPQANRALSACLPLDYVRLTDHALGYLQPL